MTKSMKPASCAAAMLILKPAERLNSAQMTRHYGGLNNLNFLVDIASAQYLLLRKVTKAMNTAKLIKDIIFSTVLFTGLLLLSIYTAMHCEGSDSSSVSSKHQDIAESSYEITDKIATGPGTSQSYIGSGTAISPTQVLTCWHTFREHNGRGNVLTIRKNSFHWKVKLLASTENPDLALLEILPGQKDLDFVPLADYDVNDGTPVQVTGYGFHRNTNTGRPADLGIYETTTKRNIYAVPSLLTNCVAAQGDSGGGVFYKGKLIGVVWGAANGETHAEPIGTIVRWLSVQEKQCSSCQNPGFYQGMQQQQPRLQYVPRQQPQQQQQQARPQQTFAETNEAPPAPIADKPKPAVQKPKSSPKKPQPGDIVPGPEVYTPADEDGEKLDELGPGYYKYDGKGAFKRIQIKSVTIPGKGKDQDSDATETIPENPITHCKCKDFNDEFAVKLERLKDRMLKLETKDAERSEEAELTKPAPKVSTGNKKENSPAKQPTDKPDAKPTAKQPRMSALFLTASSVAGYDDIEQLIRQKQNDGYEIRIVRLNPKNFEVTDLPRLNIFQGSNGASDVVRGKSNMRHYIANLVK